LTSTRGGQFAPEIGGQLQRILHQIEKSISLMLAHGKLNRGYINGWMNEMDFSDNSLFKGTSGIGFIYLRFLNKDLRDSIIYPYLDSKKIAEKFVEIPKLNKKIIVDNHFTYSSKFVHVDHLFQASTQLIANHENLNLTDQLLEQKSTILLDLKILQKKRSINFPQISIANKRNQELFHEMESPTFSTDESILVCKSEGVLIDGNKIRLFNENGSISEFTDHDGLYTIFLSNLDKSKNIKKYIEDLNNEIEFDYEDQPLLVQVIKSLALSNIILLNKWEKSSN
jgi:hypothetical protein